VAEAKSVVGLDVRAVNIVAVVLDAESGELRTFGVNGDEPGRVSRRLRIEDDLFSGQETLRGCHDLGSTQMS
jgi:hypothetical protein